jgi:pyruvate formate lyase activating enzyme
MLTPLITEIQRFSLQDGPGIRTTIFLKGCPLHCPWCHNPETLIPKNEFYFYVSKCTACGRCAKVCPSGALRLAGTPNKTAVLNCDRSKCILCMKCVGACLFGAREVVGKSLDIGSIVREAVADKMFYHHSEGGVTISGGEPLLYPEFTLELARILKTKEKVHVTIETSCFANWDKIEPLLEFVDLFIVDIKSMDAEKHKYAIGGSLQVILSNIERLISFKATVRIHLPIIPGFNDSTSEMEAYVKYLGQFADKLSGVDVLPFHSYAMGKYSQLGREYQYNGINDLPSVRLMPLVEALKQVGLRQVTVGGFIERQPKYAMTVNG